MMDLLLDKAMPTNLEAERALLGAILMDNAMPQDLNPADLYLEAHRRILAGMQALAEKAEPINLLSVKNILAQGDNLEASGGGAYLASLTDGLPNIELAPQYVRMIRKAAAMRRIISIGNAAMESGFRNDEEPRVVSERILDGCDEVNSLLEEDAGLKPITEFLGPAFEQMEARTNNKDTGAFGTGFEDIDRVMLGGVRPRAQTLIAGRPGSGKTALIGNILVNMSKKGIGCGFFSLEMAASELIERMIASEAQVDLSRIATGYITKTDWQRIVAAAGVISRLPVYIDDSTGISVNDMRSRVRKVRGKIKVIATDYLQLLNAPDRMSKAANEFAQVGAISKALKFWAKSEDLALLTLSQLSRAPEQRKDRKPQLSDLRSSGNLEQDADNVLFVYREELSNPTEENNNLAEIVIAKQRSGPVGNIKLTYRKNLTRFENLYSQADDYQQSRHWE